MKNWNDYKLINGIRITAFGVLFLVTALLISIDNLSSIRIDLVLYGILTLLTVQGFMIDTIVKRIKAKQDH